MTTDEADAGKPLVALAPMAGLSDLPFRRLVAEFGCDLVVSEMVASREMIRARPDMLARAALDDAGCATAVQLAGCEARWMAEAARMIADAGARVIDINMGCPAKTVTGAAAGSALMRDPDAALRLVEATVAAAGVPVTLKMRLGWDDGQRNAAEIARRAVDAGVTRIVVHGRTRCQFYKGRADWAAIGAVAGAVPVPVLANGDIDGPATARAALDASGAAGVMVGRASRGAPWLCRDIADGLAGRALRAAPQGAALRDLAARHLTSAWSHYGRGLGTKITRKHLDGYLRAAGATPDARRAVLTAAPEDVLGRLDAAVAVAA